MNMNISLEESLALLSSYEKSEVGFKEELLSGDNSLLISSLKKVLSAATLFKSIMDSGVNNQITYPNFSKIKFIAWKFNTDENYFQIEGKNLTYASISENHLGVQCAHTGGTPKHKLITNKLNQVNKLLLEIEDLQKTT